MGEEFLKIGRDANVFYGWSLIMYHFMSSCPVLYYYNINSLHLWCIIMYLSCIIMYYRVYGL